MHRFGKQNGRGYTLRSGLQPPVTGGANRREVLAAGCIAPLLMAGHWASAAGPAIEPSMLPYLAGLDLAVKELANTWRPDDPQYQADVYQQILMNLSYGYFVFFNADAEHPDWSPIWNSVYRQQPNPDTVYLYAPVRGDLTYRVSGSRGTCNQLVFSTHEKFVGSIDHYEEMKTSGVFDDRSFTIDANGDFEIIFSGRRPPGFTGNWKPITRATDTLLARFVMQDWLNERDPQLSIECLDTVPLKKRLTPAEIIERMRSMAKLPAQMDRLYFGHQNDLKRRLGVNRFELSKMSIIQYYWLAVFEFSRGEALIIETELPKVRRYWNLQLNDPYYNVVEFVYRLSSINGATAVPSADGKLRAVVALDDPGVPNWLDPEGFTEGMLWGRWYGCDSTPLPTIRRVPLSELHSHLPANTPRITPEQRAEALRARVRAYQRRRRW